MKISMHRFYIEVTGNRGSTAVPNILARWGVRVDPPSGTVYRVDADQIPMARAKYLAEQAERAARRERRLQRLQSVHHNSRRAALTAAMPRLADGRFVPRDCSAMHEDIIERMSSLERKVDALLVAWGVQPPQPLLHPHL
jgi:hypothetical protein